MSNANIMNERNGTNSKTSINYMNNNKQINKENQEGNIHKSILNESPKSKKEE